jgi:hypothetical protein
MSVKSDPSLETDDLDALRTMIRYASQEADRMGHVHLAYLLELAAIEAQQLPDSSERIWPNALRAKPVTN